MRPSKLVAAIALLLVCGPVLVFPDLLPAEWRTSVVTVLTCTSFALGLAMLQPWKRLRLGLWLFLATVVASWALMPAHSLVGVRHFAGIGVGVLAMAAVATWCSTVDRLVATTLLFAVASIGVLTLGLLGTSFDFKTSKFTGWTRLFPPRILPQVPEVKLPGLAPSESEQVNPNALGGTSLLLLPMCGGLVAAALASRRRRRFTLAAGSLATTVAVIVLAMTQSRTAWAAAVLTLVVWGLRWRRGRRWVFMALLVATTGLAYGAYRWQAAAPENFEASVQSTRLSALARLPIWHHALNLVREAPWLGIGINQYHPNELPHAHNTLIQVALDVGVLGLCGYILLFGTLLIAADRAARWPGEAGRIAGGAGLSLVGVHLFGIGDAIALGAKVGLFQWLCAGLILAASHLPPPATQRQV